jgi:hypothetical protein
VRPRAKLFSLILLGLLPVLVSGCAVSLGGSEASSRADCGRRHTPGTAGYDRCLRDREGRAVLENFGVRKRGR